MEKHYGEIIERTIRRNGYSISELSRLMKVNRRSIYNWFNQPKFKPDIIFKIGCALKHDFSNEFPELFSSDEFQKVFNDTKKTLQVRFLNEEHEKVSYWKDKYINLLEEYNQILSVKSGNTRTASMSGL
ncbi:helix-turn-helix domain-containing protein [Olivibacter sp. XZL3]|uniref:helix-turn-helix domain-containing protein n=1 Tax=Olivibacter sp. XZL3 TaxID=1735116 RepID=UPI0010657039|nr:helix-turn-helix domain containing protein [Olivibacter sp. XZL3]